MLNNIKSTYFIKIIFTYVEEKQKLKVVNYNKNIQKLLDINIINYKYSTGKYIIYESNKIRKEYNASTDTLIYKGGHLNGKRNGKGKEYYNGKLIFVGEYLSGLRNGKGKNYDWINGELWFEGNYLKGKRNGKGKEYNIIYMNRLSFEGEYLNDKYWIGTKYLNSGKIDYILKNNINGDGIGLEYWDNGFCQGTIKYEGEYLKGKRNGKGKEYYEDGEILFEGEYYNDLRWNGKGYDHSHNIVYELKNGTGLVKEYHKINKKDYILEFEGECLYGKKTGKGKEYHYLDGRLEYEGEYLNGKKHGKGKEYKLGELEFEGEYLYDYKLKGKYYIRGYLEYEGEYLYNKKYN